MSHRIMRRVILVAAALVALPAAALAQTSRVEGMALQGDYLKDYTNIFSYTSCLTSVGNLVYGELGQVTSTTTEGANSVDDRAMGAVLGNLWDGEYGTWAIHMREISPNLGQNDQASHAGLGLGFDPNFNRNEAFDLMWGKKFGTTSLGLRLNRSYRSGENDLGLVDPGWTNLTKFETDFPDTTSDAPNLRRNVLGLGGGVGFEMNPNTNIEFNFLWQARTFNQEYTTPGEKDEEDGSTAYLFTTRAMWQWQPNVLVVPVFKYYSYDLSWKHTESAGVTAFEATSKGWQVGAAGNWTLNQNDLFVLGATIASNKLEQSSTGVDENTTDLYAPQIFAALETHVNTWLTLRFGANKGVFHTTKFEDSIAPSTSVKLKDSPFDMMLGVGMKFGSLQLDGVLNPTFPQNMPYLVSGNQTDPMFGKVSATYSF
jgi:hypothetical protein